MWKQTVPTISEQILPGIAIGATHIRTRDMPQNDDELGSKITASLPLQVALYFNIALAPIWFSAIILMLPLKYEHLPELNKTILIIVLASAFLIEITRLYMGYFGHLKENIPLLAGFWMLSLLLQAPLQILLLHPELRPSLVECVVQAVMCSLLAVQLVTGFSTLHALAKRSSDVFYIGQYQAQREGRDKVDTY